MEGTKNFSPYRTKRNKEFVIKRICIICSTKYDTILWFKLSLSHNKTKSLLAIWPTNFGKLNSRLAKRILKPEEKHLASLKNHNVVVNTGK